MKSTSSRKIASDLMKVIGVGQFILSLISLISLGGLLFIRDKVVSTISNQDLMLSESVKLDAIELTPVAILISLCLLAIALILAVSIFRSGINYLKGKKFLIYHFYI